MLPQSAPFMFDNLDDNNFILYAAKVYDNPHCLDTAEFLDDLNRFKYLKRLFNKYEDSGELRERLILNHIMIIYNVFGVEPATRMLFFKLRGFEPYLKPFLIKLSVMPEHIYGIGIEGNTINSSDITMDVGIVDVLRTI